VYVDIEQAERAAPDEPASQTPRGTPVGRRVVLGMLGLGALGIIGGARLQNGLGDVLAPIQNHDPTGLSGLIPTGGGFRYYSVTSSEPNRTHADYRLKVSGLVRRPMTLSMDDLARLPQTSLVKDFQCVTGWRVPQVHWSGVKLADLLDRVRPTSAARAVRFTSFDGEYTESLTMPQAMRSDVLVATSMLGGPVSRAHGGPVRLYVAPMYGYKSCKWLGGIEVLDHVQTGFWEQYGYDVNGWVGKSNGRSDAPTS